MVAAARIETKVVICIARVEGLFGGDSCKGQKD